MHQIILKTFQEFRWQGAVWRRCGTRKKVRRRKRDTSDFNCLWSLLTGVLSSHFASSFPVFFSRFIPRFMPPLLPVHLEKASHLSALYSAAAPARALASIMFWILMICCVLIRRMAVNPHLLYFTNKTTSKVIVRKPVPSINMITPHTLHCRFKLQFVTKGLLDIRVYTKQTVIWKDIPMLRSH